MKTLDYLVKEYKGDDDLISEMMLVTEESIFNEILEIDAITKWQEIEQATKENRQINFIPYEKTNIPNRIVKDLNFQKAVQKRVTQMTDIFFNQMEIETFEKWIMLVDVMEFQAKKRII